MLRRCLVDARWVRLVGTRLPCRFAGQWGCFSSLSELLSQVVSESSKHKDFVAEVRALGKLLTKPGWDPCTHVGTGSVTMLSPDHVLELVKALCQDPVGALRVYIWAARQPCYRHNDLVRHQVVQLWPDNELIENFLHMIDNPSELDSKEDYLLTIKGYGWAGMPDAAMATLTQMTNAEITPSVYHFNSLLYVLVQCKRLKNIRELYKNMQESGVVPNWSTYALRVRAYCVVGQFEEGFKAFCQMLRANFPVDIKTFGHLIDALCKANAFPYIYVIPCYMRDNRVIPDANIVYELFEGLCRNSCVKHAEKLVKLISKRGVEPNARVCNILAKGLCRERKGQSAYVMLNEMLKRGILPDANVFDMVLILLFKEGRLGNIYQLMNKLMERGFSPYLSSYDILIYGLSKCEEIGKAFDAWSILVRYRLPGGKAYRALLQGLCSLGRLSDAKEVFKMSLDRGDPGDVGAHDVLLYRLKQAGRLNDARECEGILETRKQAAAEMSHLDVFEGLSLVSIDAGFDQETRDDELGLSSDVSDSE